MIDESKALYHDIERDQACFFGGFPVSQRDTPLQKSEVDWRFENA
jgi:hypothetical protein